MYTWGFCTTTCTWRDAFLRIFLYADFQKILHWRTIKSFTAKFLGINKINKNTARVFNADVDF